MYPTPPPRHPSSPTRTTLKAGCGGLCHHMMEAAASVACSKEKAFEQTANWIFGETDKDLHAHFLYAYPNYATPANNFFTQWLNA